MKKKTDEEKVSDDDLSRLISTSVISIVLCLVCLVSTTWAWYSLSVASDKKTIYGAGYEIKVHIDDEEASDPLKTEGYTFEGGTHQVRLTKHGDAKNVYCIVTAIATESAAGTQYYASFNSETDREDKTTYLNNPGVQRGFVLVTVTGAGSINIRPVWGEPLEDSTPLPEEGIVFEETPLTASPEMMLPTETAEEEKDPANTAGAEEIQTELLQGDESQEDPQVEEEQAEENKTGENIPDKENAPDTEQSGSEEIAEEKTVPPEMSQLPGDTEAIAGSEQTEQ